MHASGTRTDRGLEAITLSVPPTPRSVIKRPHNENMLSWGSVMKEKGYDVKFLYGGYGYFDNMNYFFGHNGLRLSTGRTSTGRTFISRTPGGCATKICFKRRWRSPTVLMEQASFLHPHHDHFQSPSLYVSRRRESISLPIPGERGSQVRGLRPRAFLDAARKKPWFDDTVFVVVADHCASSAGKTALPVKRYEIPLHLFSRGHFPPQRIDTLAGQIDIAPTVMGLLHFKYSSGFFGRDILRERPGEARSLISTYQKLGYMKDDRLAVLDVKREVSTYRFDRNTGEMTQIPPDPGA
ncbi:MAG: sulfatase-like hydrolase/transferase [Thermodesulfovibrionales bacterium]